MLNYTSEILVFKSILLLLKSAIFSNSVLILFTVFISILAKKLAWM